MSQQTKEIKSMYAHPLLNRTYRSAAIPALLQPRRFAAASSSERVLVPTDGTAAEEAALDHAIKLARAAPVAVHLLNVQPPVMAGDVTLFTTAEAAAQQRRSAGELALKRAGSALAAAGVEYTTEVALGSPATEIVRSAAAHGCTKIVMATRNTGIMKLLLRRSVSHRVVRSASVPVTLVKPSSVRAEARCCRATRVLQIPGLCTWRKRSCAVAGTYRAAQSTAP
jgi:nucleotide-binding universal stress UspA family protein